MLAVLLVAVLLVAVLVVKRVMAETDARALTWYCRYK
jgi:hypothetical protein